MVSETNMIKVARTSRHKKMQHAAFVFCGGALMNSASNSQYVHAEVNALRQVAPKALEPQRRLTVLSVRVTKRGLLRLARPCEECMVYMKEKGVQTVLFSTDAGTIERMRV